MPKWNVCFDLNSFITIEVIAPNESAARDAAENAISRMSEGGLKDLLYSTYLYGGANFATAEKA